MAEDAIYFGVGFVKSSFSKTDDGGVKSEYTERNYKLLIGNRLSDSMSIEIQYADFSTGDITFNDKKRITVNGVQLSSTQSGRSIGVARLYHFNRNAAFSPFVKFGMHYWDIKANLKLDDKRVTGKDDGFDMFYSVGVDGKIPFSV